MRRHQHASHEMGISIVEILVALTVIAVMFAALINVQLQSLQVSRASKQASSATQIANELITEMTQSIFEPQTSSSLDEWIVYYYSCPTISPPTGAPYGCTGGGSVTSSPLFDPAITTGIAGADQYTYSFTITGLKTLPATTVESYLRQGLVALTLSIAGPSDSEITVLLSCLDASFTPQLQQGEPCPDPTTGA
jgi:type II secretory pathway pseudopilin PulG